MSEGSEAVIPGNASPSYELPLSLDALQNALRRGQGRAYLHAIHHHVPADLLVHALTHNLRYDRQCEDAAQDWYLAMALRHPEAPTILQQVIAHVSGLSCSDHKHYVAGTLAAMHRMGIPEALPALYALTSTSDKNYSPPVPGGDELIEIEGEKGLLHILRTLASALPDGLVDQWMIHSYFRQTYKDSSGECADKLAAWAAVDESFRPLLDIVLGIHSSQVNATADETQTTEVTLRSLHTLSKKQLRETPAGVVIDLVRKAPEDDIGAAVRSWALLATRDTLDEIISETLVEDNPHRIHKYLRAFTERSPLHRYDQRFAGWLDHPLEKLRWTAHHALATCPDPRVRELALQRLTNEEVARGSIQLFQSTYQPGDHRAIESALYLPDDINTMHDIGFSLLDVFRNNPSPDALRSMLFVYEHGPCMNCRLQAVRVMQSSGVLPAWVSEESRFDADSGIRECVSGSEAIPTPAG